MVEGGDSKVVIAKPSEENNKYVGVLSSLTKDVQYTNMLSFD